MMVQLRGVQGDERLSKFDGPTAPRLLAGIGGMAADCRL